MFYRRLLVALPLLLVATAVALATPAKDFRSFKGTWMCPECAALKQADTPEECEAKGHKHALKLDDGQMITFVESPRAAALVHGGGREKAKIEVYGFYDTASQTIDVETYRIDGVWSAWCENHSRMDACRSMGEAGAAETQAKN